MRNVRPFREEPNWLDKSLTALGYLLLGWVVTSHPVLDMGGLLSLFMILGILVWVFFVRKKSLKYFIRYHVVQALLLNISLAALLWLFVALLSFVAAIPGLHIIADPIAVGIFTPHQIAGVIQASAKDIIVMTIAISMVFYTLRGRYAELPWITEGARHWL